MNSPSTSTHRVALKNYESSKESKDLFCNRKIVLLHSECQGKKEMRKIDERLHVRIQKIPPHSYCSIDLPSTHIFSSFRVLFVMIFRLTLHEHEGCQCFRPEIYCFPAQLLCYLLLPTSWMGFRIFVDFSLFHSRSSYCSVSVDFETRSCTKAS